MKANHLTTKLLILITITIITGVLYLFLGIDWDILEYQLQSRVRKLILMLLVGELSAPQLLFSSNYGQSITDALHDGPRCSVHVCQSTAYLCLRSPVDCGNQSLFKLRIDFSSYDIIRTFIVPSNGGHGTFFRSITGFIELVINPEEFLAVQSSMFANFNASNEKLVAVCG